MTTNEASNDKSQPDQGPTYELTLIGDGMELKRPVSQEVALEIIASVMGGTPSSGSGATPKPRETYSGRKSDSGTGAKLSVREFLAESGAKRNPDKIVSIAAYLRDQAGREEFSRDDVKGQFQRAGEPTPGNFSRDFTWAVSEGWIAESSESAGQFYVTKTGDNAIAQKFETKKKSPPKPRRRRSRKSTDAEG